MPDTLQKALRARLLRAPAFRTLLEHLHHLTGLDTLFLDPLGNILLSHPRRETRPLCRALHTHPSTRDTCIRHRLGLLSHPDSHQPAPACCSAGLRQIIHPLRINDQTLGHLLLIGYRDPDSGEDETRSAWTRTARAGGPLSWVEWKTQWQTAPRFTPEQIQAVRHWIDLGLRDVHRRLQDHQPADLLAPENVLPAKIHYICESIRQHYGQPVRLGDLAADCNLSPEHLSRLFHQTTGLRFKDYLTEVRLNRACELLLETDDLIADISAHVGYSTLSRFNRSFREHTGMTPSEYRKRKKPFFRSSEKGS